MYAVIEIPDFSLQALLRLRPDLSQKAVGLLRGEGRRAAVLQVSPLAAHLTLGCSGAQALADCPDIHLVAPSPDAEREADALLLGAAWALSPRVEPSAPGRCTVDLAGANERKILEQCVRVHASLQGHGLEAKLGIASTPLIARYAAYRAQPIRQVDDERAFLATLPVTMLDLSEDEARLMADLGLQTLGAITAFPRAAFANRLGQRGDELWSQAAGEWKATVQAAPFPVRYHASLSLEEPVETLEPLLFTLKRFCERLADEVGQFGGGTNRVALELLLENEGSHRREFALPEPTAKSDVIFSVLENHLFVLQTDSAIVGVALEVFPARRLEQQEGLFDTGLKDAPMFYASIARLTAIVGAESVGTPCRQDTHRPDAVTLATPKAIVPERHVAAAPEPHGPLFRRFRPPIAATVELTDLRPTYLVSAMTNGPVAVVRQPFRANGEWWSPDAWTREEWDVEIGGGLYRVLHDPSGWFIEGVYD